MTTLTPTTNALLLPDGPEVPGLTFRRFRGETDYLHMVAVLTGCKEADQVERVDSVEEIARAYSLLRNCDPYQDMIFAEVDGDVIGYGRVTWAAEPNGQRLYINFGWVLPAWRRRGIGQAMLRWQERRLREIAAQHPHTGPRLFTNAAWDGEQGRHALLHNEGYRPVTYGAIMVRPDLENIPEAPLPPGVEVRPVKPEHLRAIWDAAIEAFRDHWSFVEPGEEDYQNYLSFPYTDTSLWRIAWEGDQVVGQVRSFINPDENAEYGRQRGWTEDISVRKPWRRRGIARALLVQSLHAVKERGMTEAALGVHTENPNGAFQLYQSVGFEVMRMETVYRKPMS